MCRIVGHKTHRGRRPKDDALFDQLVDSAFDHGLFHLELGDPKAQQPTGLLGSLEDDDVVTSSDQLLGGSEARRAGSHDGHPLAGALERSLGGHPSLGPGAFDDLELDPLDCYRVVVDADHAASLARGGAESTSELGKVIGGVEALDGRRPITSVDEVVPLGDQVPEGAALMTERNAAVHAAGTLSPCLVLTEWLVDLAPVTQPDRNRPTLGKFARELKESAWLTHVRPP